MIRRSTARKERSEFARRLASWMALAGLNDNDLAQVVGVEAMTVSRWRRDINQPTTDRWPLLASALGVDVEEIAKLLLGVTLLPADVQVLAERLAALPPRQRAQVVAQIDGLLQGEDRHLNGLAVAAQPTA